MDDRAFDLTRNAAGRPGVLEALVTLTGPRSRVSVHLPAGEAGRAEAVFEGRSWAAKHYWREAPDLVIYEFDEPLPAGPITLRIPFAGRGASH